MNVQEPNEKTQPAATRACRECRCTQNHACAGGCWWVAPDLCSTCARALDAFAREALAKGT